MLKTIESNIEALIDKIQRCHPGQSKNSYSFLKFSQSSSFANRMEGSILERSSLLASPNMVSEEMSIESIFKLLNRADKSLETLSDNLKNEAKFRNQVTKKIDFQNLKTSENNERNYLQKIEDIKSGIHDEYAQKITNIVNQNTELVNKIKQEFMEEQEERYQKWQEELKE